MKQLSFLSTVFVLSVLTSGCALMRSHAPMPTVERVDLERFMGDWYVVANIPTFIEKEAYNALESYELNRDGTVATTFSFNKGGFDGPRKQYNPKGFIRDEKTNALWGMQFIWPFKADYRIVFLDADYTQTVIGRKQRDYVWIMARTPSISDEDFLRLRAVVEDLDYDVTKLQKVPQRP